MISDVLLGAGAIEFRPSGDLAGKRALHADERALYGSVPTLPLASGDLATLRGADMDRVRTTGAGACSEFRCTVDDDKLPPSCNDEGEEAVRLGKKSYA